MIGFNNVYVQIEKHELLEMRRVAAYIYKKAGRWKQSIALSKKDNLYKDCMETCSQSGDRELSEDLLVYFIEQVYFLIPFLEIPNSSIHISKPCQVPLCGLTSAKN